MAFRCCRTLPTTVRDKLLLVRGSTLRAPVRSNFVLLTAGGSPRPKRVYEHELVTDDLSGGYKVMACDKKRVGSVLVSLADTEHQKTLAPQS